jgi:hypothetical protein
MVESMNQKLSSNDNKDQQDQLLRHGTSVKKFLFLDDKTSYKRPEIDMKKLNNQQFVKPLLYFPHLRSLDFQSATERHSEHYMDFLMDWIVLAF